MDRPIGFVDFSALAGPGIYALVQFDAPVYVGKAKRLYQRVYSHLNLWTKAKAAKDGGKSLVARGYKVIPFSKVWALPCGEAELDKLERRYIEEWRPKHNVLLHAPPAFTLRPEGFALNVAGIMLEFKSLAPEFVRRI